MDGDKVVPPPRPSLPKSLKDTEQDKMLADKPKPPTIPRKPQSPVSPKPPEVAKRPPDVARKPPDIAKKPPPVLQRPSKPKASDRDVPKKRPEITIVSARPMGDMWFKNLCAPDKSKEKSPDVKPHGAPPPEIKTEIKPAQINIIEKSAESKPPKPAAKPPRPISMVIKPSVPPPPKPRIRPRSVEIIENSDPNIIANLPDKNRNSSNSNNENQQNVITDDQYSKSDAVNNYSHNSESAKIDHITTEKPHAKPTPIPKPRGKPMNADKNETEKLNKTASQKSLEDVFTKQQTEDPGPFIIGEVKTPAEPPGRKRPTIIRPKSTPSAKPKISTAEKSIDITEKIENDKDDTKSNDDTVVKGVRRLSTENVHSKIDSTEEDSSDTNDSVVKRNPPISTSDEETKTFKRQSSSGDSLYQLTLKAKLSKSLSIDAKPSAAPPKPVNAPTRPPRAKSIGYLSEKLKISAKTEETTANTDLITQNTNNSNIVLSENKTTSETINKSDNLLSDDNFDNVPEVKLSQVLTKPARQQPTRPSKSPVMVKKSSVSDTTDNSSTVTVDNKNDKHLVSISDDKAADASKTGTKTAPKTKSAPVRPTRPPTRPPSIPQPTDLVKGKTPLSDTIKENSTATSEKIPSDSMDNGKIPDTTVKKQSITSTIRPPPVAKSDDRKISNTDESNNDIKSAIVFKNDDVKSTKDVTVDDNFYEEIGGSPTVDVITKSPPKRPSRPPAAPRVIVKSSDMKTKDVAQNDETKDKDDNKNNEVVMGSRMKNEEEVQYAIPYKRIKETDTKIIKENEVTIEEIQTDTLVTLPQKPEVLSDTTELSKPTTETLFNSTSLEERHKRHLSQFSALDDQLFQSRKLIENRKKSVDDKPTEINLFGDAESTQLNDVVRKDDTNQRLSGDENAIGLTTFDQAKECQEESSRKSGELEENLAGSNEKIDSNSYTKDSKERKILKTKDIENFENQMQMDFIINEVSKLNEGSTAETDCIDLDSEPPTPKQTYDTYDDFTFKNNSTSQNKTDNVNIPRNENRNSRELKSSPGKISKLTEMNIIGGLKKNVQKPERPKSRPSRTSVTSDEGSTVATRTSVRSPPPRPPKRLSQESPMSNNNTSQFNYNLNNNNNNNNTNSANGGYEVPTITIIPNTPNPGRESTSISGSHCVAKFAYNSGFDGDLSFNEGDTIRLLGKVDEEWASGELGSKTGIFPFAFVEMIEDVPQMSSGYDDVRFGEVLDDVAVVNDNVLVDDVLHPFSAYDDVVIGDVIGGGISGDVKNGDVINADVISGGDDVTSGDVIISDIVSGDTGGGDGDDVKSGAAKSGDVTFDDIGEPQVDHFQLVEKEMTVDDLPPFCTAVYDFEMGLEGDLSFTTGQVITILERRDDKWLFGKIDATGQSGIFPVEFVKFE